MDRVQAEGGQESGRGRIVTLDVIRGVAVMGILLANLPAFGLPEAAYFSPVAAGGTAPADLAAWAATFVLVEGKFRGLFSFLFGASMLLVVERAETAGDNPASVHFSRMAWLFLFGLAHLYLFWWGDILTHYALVGAVAYGFRSLSVRWLLAVGIAATALATLTGAETALAAVAAHARDTPAAMAAWQAFQQGFGTPSPAALAAEVAARRGGFADGVAWRLGHATGPLTALLVLGPQTLGLMLLGMAGLRSGLLTGAWPVKRYRRLALVTLGLTLPLDGALAVGTAAHGFDVRWVVAASIGIAVPVLPVTVAGYAAVLAMIAKAGGAWGRSLVRRLAATGRMAFSSYLGTTLAMTALFDGWGLGRFDRWSRAELYLAVPVVWGAMLGLSGWWLARFRQGPLEWLWRSLARLEWQPMRRIVR